MSTRRHQARPFPALHRKQRGVVLFVALIVLVAMTLAGLATMRSVDTNNVIAGNLALRNAAIGAGDAGLEAARNWLVAQNDTVLLTDLAPGYFANWQDTSFNHKTFDWAGSGTNVGTDSFGNTIYYVVHRMCRDSGAAITGTVCSKVVAETQGGSEKDNAPRPASTQKPYFRLSAKVIGPRNTVSYLQSFVY